LLFEKKIIFFRNEKYWGLSSDANDTPFVQTNEALKSYNHCFSQMNPNTAWIVLILTNARKTDDFALGDERYRSNG